jgi:hypothetical protein
MFFYLWFCLIQLAANQIEELGRPVDNINNFNLKPLNGEE